jgi:hypothetical protein
MSPLDPKSKLDYSIEVGDRLYRTLLEGRLLLRSNMALQAEVSESHLEFEEARWQLRETMARIREGRRQAGGLQCENPFRLSRGEVAPSKLLR